MWHIQICSVILAVRASSQFNRPVAESFGLFSLFLSSRAIQRKCCKPSSYFVKAAFLNGSVIISGEEETGFP